MSIENQYFPANVSDLDRYIQSTHQAPMLTLDEELSLANKLKQTGDLNAAKTLIIAHLRVVVSIARTYAGYGLQQADLIQEGNIGLMKAVKRFDPDRGVRLFSFAVHWIKAEINEFVLKNWRLVRIATTKPQRKLFFNLRSMRSSLNTLSPKEVASIARDLGVKTEDVLDMELRMSGHDIPLIKEDDDNDDHYAPIHWLVDNHNEPSLAIERANDNELHDRHLHNALALLDDRSRHIIQSRWLAQESAATLHELASELGISAERVRQIEVKAMSTMKKALLPYQDH
jgi:RNA polymerase sigma-32 factor